MLRIRRLRNSSRCRETTSAREVLARFFFSVSFRLQAGHLISVAGSNSFPSHSHSCLLVSGSAAAGSVV